MRLLLDEMYSPVVAAESRNQGFDVVSVHDFDGRRLESASDEEIFSAAVALERAIITENVADFRRLETQALGRGEPCPGLIYTTNRQFPRRGGIAVGRLVVALATFLEDDPSLSISRFLAPVA